MRGLQSAVLINDGTGHDGLDNKLTSFSIRWRTTKPFAVFVERARAVRLPNLNQTIENRITHPINNATSNSDRIARQIGSQTCAQLALIAAFKSSKLRDATDVNIWTRSLGRAFW